MTSERERAVQSIRGSLLRRTSPRAHMLLDAGLAVGLYRRLLRTEHRSWLTTAVRSTIIPVCFVAALLALAGTIMQDVYPDAVSIGKVVNRLRADEASIPR
jgi:hypothetical protein